MILWGIPYQNFPELALACNIIVVSGNSFNYTRAGNLNLKLLFPYLLGSIPFALLGGTVQIDSSYCGGESVYCQDSLILGDINFGDLNFSVLILAHDDFLDLFFAYSKMENKRVVQNPGN